MDNCRRKDDVADVEQQRWQSEQRRRRENDGSAHNNQSRPFRENAQPSADGAVGLSRFHGLFVVNFSLSEGPLVVVSSRHTWVILG